MEGISEGRKVGFHAVSWDPRTLGLKGVPRSSSFKTECLAWSGVWD